jgi:DNA (cytosine-5)-methyltransferase 1
LAVAKTVLAGGHANNPIDENLVAHSLRGEGFDASEDGTGRGTPLVPIAFDTTQITSKTNRCNPQPDEPCHPLAAGHPPAIAFDARQSDVIQYGDKTGPLDTDGHTMAIQSGWAVRRLTPRECERLQGFPGGYTDVPWRKKNWTPDGPRYKALGNSMAVNAMRWLGTRIQMVSEIAAIQERAA